MSKDKVVFPSDYLGVEEEFLQGDGTFLDKDHNIKASIFGEKYIDKLNYRIKVFGKVKPPLTPKFGDSVIGTVTRVSKYSLLIQVHYINGKNVYPEYSAVMHITDISNDYVEVIDEMYVVGDVVRAKIVDAHTLPVQLSTKDREYGVVFSWCSICGEESKKKGKDKIECKTCGNIEPRKTSIDYGKSMIE
jgi:exosome complex component CSL4